MSDLFKNTSRIGPTYKYFQFSWTVDRVSKKSNVSEYNKTFNVQSSGKFKNFLLKKFFMIFQNGGDICSDIYVVKTRLFCPVCQVKF